MLPDKLKAASKFVSLLGEVDVITNQLKTLNIANLNRTTREQGRQCIIAASLYKNKDSNGFSKVKKMIRGGHNINELTSRTAAFGAALAIKEGHWRDADSFLQLASHCPPIITTSLSISALSKQKRLDEALDCMEKVLANEEFVFASENYCVSDEALDLLHAAIKEKGESVHQMKRFRTLQRLITKFGRRSSLSLDQCLTAPIKILSYQQTEPETWESIPDKIIPQIPLFLSKEN